MPTSPSVDPSVRPYVRPTVWPSGRPSIRPTVQLKLGQLSGIRIHQSMWWIGIRQSAEVSCFQVIYCISLSVFHCHSSIFSYASVICFRNKKTYIRIYGRGRCPIWYHRICRFFLYNCCRHLKKIPPIPKLLLQQTIQWKNRFCLLLHEAFSVISIKSFIFGIFKEIIIDNLTSRETDRTNGSTEGRPC